MRHQIVAIGDPQLHAAGTRNAERLRAFDSIIDIGLSLPRLAAWLVLGDFFEGRSTIQDRNDLAVRLRRMADAAPVFGVYGNHDQPGDLSVFQQLAARWPIFIAESPWTRIERLATGVAAEIAMLPYPHKAGLIAAGVTSESTLNEGDACLDAIFRGFAAGIADAGERGRLALFMGHVNVEGSKSSSGQTMIGRELSATTEMLRALGPIPKLLGHIHLPQTIGDACYVGSISANSWGETEQKRIVIVEMDDDGSFELVSHDIGTPKMFHIEGDWTRGGFELAEGLESEIERRYHSGDWSGCEVRCRYRFPSSERALVNEDAIRTLFSAAARLDLEPVAIPDRGLRAPEVAAAHTLAEKLGAWCAFGGFDKPTDSLLAKLASLEHLDGQAVLSGVSDQVAAIEHTRFEGKSARDYFAAMALMGLSRSHAEGTVDDYQPQFVAEDCYKLADAMLAARSRGGAK